MKRKKPNLDVYKNTKIFKVSKLLLNYFTFETALK